jgi:uncharacterized protein (DUF58 family)
VSAAAASFPLVLRRRHIGLAFGATPSSRRGSGSDVAGSRPYRRGDAMRGIDWAASARLSAARSEDAFIVRERFADESPRVVVVADRRPAMALCPSDLPWLDKAATMRNAGLLIATSTARSRGAIGSLDFGDGDIEPVWLSPKPSGQWRVEERAATGPFAAPADSVERSLTYLGTLRSSLPVGSFVFVLSDFLADASLATWLEAIGHRWDIVPVVIQDPVWEASFPEIGGVVVTFVDAASGAVRRVRMRRGEARRLRTEHEARHDGLVRGFIELGLEPVVVTSSEPDAILAAFLSWADARLLDRRAGR